MCLYPILVSMLSCDMADVNQKSAELCRKYGDICTLDKFLKSDNL